MQIPPFVSFCKYGFWSHERTLYRLPIFLFLKKKMVKLNMRATESIQMNNKKERKIPVMTMTMMTTMTMLMTMIVIVKLKVAKKTMPLTSNLTVKLFFSYIYLDNLTKHFFESKNTRHFAYTVMLL